jgi:hypothetical protein
MTVNKSLGKRCCFILLGVQLIDLDVAYYHLSTGKILVLTKSLSYGVSLIKYFSLVTKVITGKVTPIMVKKNVKVRLASHRVVGSVFALAVFGEFLLGYVTI